jgi:transposase
MPPGGGAVWGERIECDPLGCAASLWRRACADEAGRRSQVAAHRGRGDVHSRRVAEQPDMTLAELKRKLEERGMRVGIGTLWRFFQRHRITLKKRLRTPLSRAERT